VLDGAAIVDQAWSDGLEARSVAHGERVGGRASPPAAGRRFGARPVAHSRTPYLREIMDCLSPHHPAREVVMMSSTQVGKTEVILNWIGETIHWDPAPMLVVQPTTNVAKRWSKQRFAGMIRETPSLRRLVQPVKSRDSGNTTLLKEFPGGVLVVGGANSAPDLASMPIK
jgi:phage terminase large subunit GpA-like protein